VASATGTTYTWLFTLASSANLTSFQLTVPTGTAGTPTGVTAVGDAGYAITFPVGATTLSGTTLTVPVSSTWGPSGTIVTIVVGGLTNTSTGGDYTSTVTTYASGTPTDTGTSSATTIAPGALTGPYWWPSSAVVSATATTYTAQFTTATTATLASVVITGPPGIAGTPTLGSVSGLPGGGTLSRSGSVITYSFTGTSVASGTAVTLAIAGITNPTVAGNYSLAIITRTASAPVDAVRTATATFTAGALTSPTWSADTTTAGATGASYTYSFGIGTTQWVERMTVQLPPGAAGTPTLTLLSATGPGSNPFSGGTVSRSGSVLTIDFTAAYLNAGWVVTVVVGGMTNPAAGSYVASIVTLRPSAGYAVDSGLAGARVFTSTAMNGISWSATSNLVSATGVSYLYAFSLSATSTIDAITMTVPSGTAGTPTVGTVIPAGLAGGTVSLSGTTLTYTLPSAQSVSSSATVQVTIGGLTNTASSGSYTASIVARLSGSAIASGTSPSVGFSAAALSSLSWTSSSQTTGAASTYTFGLTTPAAGMNATSITFTLPAGTTGTPALGAVSAYYSGGALTFTGTSIALSGTTLTFSFTGPYLQASTTISVAVTGLTNTTAPGSYSSTVTIFNATNPVASGATGAVAFSSVSVSAASWTSSSSAVSATAVTYTFGVTINTSSSVSKITMTLPGGTAGTPVLGTVTPAGFAGGTLTSSGGVLTYTFTSQTLAAAQQLSITVTGNTNTATPGNYTSTLTLFNSGSAVVASGSTSPIGFTSSALSAVGWTSSSTSTSQTAVTYTWTFTTGAAGTLSEAAMTVPSGTSSTPALVSATTTPAVTLAGAAISLSGTTLSLTFTGVHVPAATAFTVVVSGFTNTATAGSYSSSVVTKNSSVPRDSGVSSALAFTTPTPAGLTWSASGLVAGTPSITETFAFTTASAATLNTLVLALPLGTTGTPTILSLTPAGIASGATVSLVTGTLTLSFTATSIAAATTIALQVGGLTQTSAPGSYTVVGTSKNGVTVVDTATSTALTVAARTLTTTIACSATNACRPLPSGSTQLEIILIPGAAVPVTASVQLAVTTNAPFGYTVGVTATALTSGSAVLPQASTSGEPTVAANRFGASAALTPGGASSATLCGAYAGSSAQIGYPVSATSVWAAAAGTGVTTDTVVISNHLKVSSVQPAGIYTGTISYSVQPRYASGTGC
jgi:hypothetical protein